ncbi:MAG: WD40 repeat domain-containing protein, partial [Dolichospermum sp.]
MNRILEIGQEKLTFKGHSDWVKAIAFTPDGETVISGSRDGT